MDRAIGKVMNQVVFGQDPYTDLDFADDISLLAELLSLLIPVLEAFAEEAAAIGLEVNWDKTKVQALGTQQPDTGRAYGHEVAVVDESVYLCALTHSSVLSSYGIHCRSGLTRSAMQKSDNCIWKSRLSLSTKLKLYNVCILPIMLYGSECWALSKADARKVDALDQWCLRS